MEKLVFLLIIVVITWLHNWWKKKQSEGGADSEPRPDPAPRPRTPSPTKQPQSWEDELRRLLQGEQPPVIAPPPRPLPPALPAVIARRPEPTRRPAPVAQPDPDMQKGLPVQMPSLAQSAQAYLRASQLEAKVALHMKRVEQQVVTHRKVQVSKQIPAEIRQAIALVRHRQSQRAAIMAAVVLGPPKALED